MQTRISKIYQDDEIGQEADKILRSCVHCGFCTATCPTYQELGDELDSPRGRIYLIKQVLEGEAATEVTQTHLDRCLQCRSCETTCPSGVEYNHLLEIGRQLVNKQVRRPFKERALRALLVSVLPHEKRLKSFYTLGKIVKPLLPSSIANKIQPLEHIDIAAPQSQSHEKSIVLMKPCVQAVTRPSINYAAEHVLAKMKIETKHCQNTTCCGAIEYHLGHNSQALHTIRQNVIDWSTALATGAQAIIATSSGCLSFLKEYGYLLKDDSQFAEKAAYVSQRALAVSQILKPENIKLVESDNQRIAYQAPCSQQHVLGTHNLVKAILESCGDTVVEPDEAYLCCGSAGAYSILQPELSTKIKDRKLTALAKLKADQIVTANIGCQLQLSPSTDLPVVHWLEYLSLKIQSKKVKIA